MIFKYQKLSVGNDLPSPMKNHSRKRAIFNMPWYSIFSHYITISIIALTLSAAPGIIHLVLNRLYLYERSVHCDSDFAIFYHALFVGFCVSVSANARLMLQHICNEPQVPRSDTTLETLVCDDLSTLRDERLSTAMSMLSSAIQTWESILISFLYLTSIRNACNGWE
ncbi:hypothetical protein MMC17_003878 [Xylographa soralifera]|nr:hypothetical protein [Xylographa soralifera]